MMVITDFLLKDLNKFERSDIEEVKDIENLYEIIFFKVLFSDNDNSNDAIAIQYRSKQEIVREDPYEITRIANKREFRTIDNNHKFKNERSEIDQIQDFMEEWDEELKSMNYTLNRSRPFEEVIFYLIIYTTYLI